MTIIDSVLLHILSQTLIERGYSVEGFVNIFSDYPYLLINDCFTKESYIVE